MRNKRPPLGASVVTTSVECRNGHLVAQYRRNEEELCDAPDIKHLWLVSERLGVLATSPPILKGQKVDVPDIGESVFCGDLNCPVELGTVAMRGGSPAILLRKGTTKQD